MKKVCLRVGLSYTTKGFSCVKGITVNVEDDIAAKLLKTGRFEIVNEVAKNAPPVVPPTNGNGDPDENGNDGSGQQQNPSAASPEQLSADAIAHMKKDELIAFAAEKGIDISDCSNNNERAAKICGILGLASAVNLDL